MPIETAFVFDFGGFCSQHGSLLGSIFTNFANVAWRKMCSNWDAKHKDFLKTFGRGRQQRGGLPAYADSAEWWVNFITPSPDGDAANIEDASGVSSPHPQTTSPHNLQVLCEHLYFPKAWQVEFKARIIAMTFAANSTC